MEFHGEVVWNLTTYRDDDAARLLQIHHVEHTLQREFIEVETVAHIVVGRYGLGIVVDHDRLIAQLTGGVDGIHRTPVELNTRTDTVSA